MSKRKILAGENKNRKSAILSMSWCDFDFLCKAIPKKIAGAKILALVGLNGGASTV